MESASAEEKPCADTRETPLDNKALPELLSLDAKRRSVIRNAGPHVPQLPLKDFCARFLPKVKINPKQFKDIHTRVVRSAYRRGRWLSFPIDPADSPIGVSEDEAFSGLVDIARAVHDAAVYHVPRLKAVTLFESIPDSPPDSSNRPNKTRPDGHFVLVEPLSSNMENPHWVDIAATGEVKKNGTSKKQLTDDIAKALWSMHHTMREDASRRFTFSYTIENRTMRLWFASRSEILVSASFDFMKDTKHLVQFFLAFTFASKEQLGWDSTMHCRWDGITGHPFQYDITVRGMDTGEEVVYRTQELLSDVGADHIRGRGTRVWRVRKVIGEDVLEDVDRVLKDVWVDSDRKREGTILADIHASAKDEQVLAHLKTILLTVVMHGDVYIGEDPDHTLDKDRDKYVKNNKVRFYLHHASPNTTQSSSTNLEDGPLENVGGKKAKPTIIMIDQPVGDFRDPPPFEEPQEAVEPIYYTAKYHYRIVFEEVCTPLHKVPSLRTSVWMLYRTCRALSTLHNLGWVHRDISPGNILMHGRQVKVADLEYAKLMAQTEPSHDIRTGTAAFMSVEVQKQGYWFAPGAQHRVAINAPNIAKIEDVDDFDLEASLAADPVDFDWGRQALTEGWRYNPLHDLESVTWILGRSLFNQDHYLQRIDDRPVVRASIKCHSKAIDPTVEEDPEKRKERIKSYYDFGRSLFVTGTERLSVMYQDRYMDVYLTRHPLCPSIEPLGVVWQNMRNRLTDAYKKAELEPDQIDHTCAKDVHLEFAKELHIALVYLTEVAKGGYDVRTRSLQTEFELLMQDDKSTTSAASTSSKRTRPTEDDGSDDSISHPSKSPRTETNSSPRRSPTPSPSGARPITAVPAFPTFPAVPAAPPTLPVPAIPSPLQSPEPRTRPKRRVVAVPPATRTLRSHVRKAAVLENVLSPPILAAPSSPKRPRKPASTTARRGKATKNHEVVQAAAKVAIKSKTRKGR